MCPWRLILGRAGHFSIYLVGSGSVVLLLLTAVQAVEAAQNRRDIAVQARGTEQGRNLYANSWAFVVGINQFRSSGIGRLNYAVNDAKAVAQALQGLGFPGQNIFELSNEKATRAEIVSDEVTE